jgi:hypothetical protein
MFGRAASAAESSETNPMAGNSKVTVKISTGSWPWTRNLISDRFPILVRFWLPVAKSQESARTPSIFASSEMVKRSP